MKLKFFSLSYLALFFVISCGNETTRNTIDRRRDIEREQTDVLSQEYSSVAGTYETDSTKDKSPYDMKLMLTVVYVTRDGSLTPQPTLAGSFRMRYKSAKSDPYYSFPFKNGVYDHLSQRITVSISTAGDPITVSCPTNKALDLKCTWAPPQASDQAIDEAEVAEATSLKAIQATGGIFVFRMKRSTLKTLEDVND